jgi:tetratricopeptide (TPR) repeat protein
MTKHSSSVTSSLRAAALVAVASLVGCTTTQQELKPDPLPVAPVAKKQVGPGEAFAEGVKHFDAGQYDQAAAVFQKLLDANPKMVNAQYNLGVIAERQGQLGKAEKAYELAHRLDPTHEPTLLNLGKVYRLQDKFEQAIALYEQALKLEGKEYDVALLNNLTVAYRLAKKFDLAEATARKVLSRTKDNPDAYKNLALIYYDQGNYRLAEFISANARKLDEKDPGVYNNLGMIYLKMDEREAALGQFKKAVSLNDKFAPGHMNIGAMALSYRDYDTAEKAFSKAAGLDPTSYEIHLAHAFALDGQKGRDSKKGLAAAAEFEKVLAIKAEHPDAICGAGWAYAADKAGWEKAVSYLERCKGLPTTVTQEQQLIEGKIKSLKGMLASGAAQPKQEPKEKPKTTAGGAGLLDKVSDQAAKEEGAAPAPPAEGQAAPEGAPAPAPAPTGGQ